MLVGFLCLNGKLGNRLPNDQLFSIMDITRMLLVSGVYNGNQ